LLLALALSPIAADGQSYDRSVVETNPEPDTSAPSVTVFLDNLRPPHIRIRPSGVTWIDMPYEVRVCEAALEFITATSLKPDDAQDKSVSILSINVDAKKMPDEIKQKLVSGQRVPAINLNCLLAAGQKSKIVIMLEISANASFLVNIQVKRKITLHDLQANPNQGNGSPDPEPSILAKRRPRAYELVYYRELKPLKPSDIHKVLLSSGKEKN
jgi:hypothetical protein